MGIHKNHLNTVGFNYGQWSAWIMWWQGCPNTKTVDKWQISSATFIYFPNWPLSITAERPTTGRWGRIERHVLKLSSWGRRALSTCPDYAIERFPLVSNKNVYNWFILNRYCPLQPFAQLCRFNIWFRKKSYVACAEPEIVDMVDNGLRFQHCNILRGQFTIGLHIWQKRVLCPMLIIN